MQKYRVALLGLNSLFGQASSLLLKLCPNIYNLRLYDEIDTSTADDIRFINTPCRVEAYQGKTKLNDAIKGSDIVLIGDDIFSTPQTCFDVMAPKMQDYAKAISESSPNALIIVAASPINKLVPVLSELLQENGYYDCNRVVGTTSFHNIRANCILASYINTDPRSVFLPVVGGDSEDTIVPLFSQAKPHFNISEAVMKRLIEEIKQASPLIYEAKGSTEALNKAHATVKFLNSVIAGLRGEPNIMNIAFTKTTQVDGTEYFALPVLFGRFGIQARYGIPRILPFENDLIRESVFNLQKDTEFAKLFCKTRETAAETCSRNVAIRYRKSKEFEQFVNGLKINKKESATEDKIVDKIKPPIPVEVRHLSGDNPFDPKAFCLRHKSDNLEKNRIIPAYMRTGESISPVSLDYTLGNNNGIAQFVPKSSSAKTHLCEPAVCPDKPNQREISFNSIVSLVESLVKKTTEKMILEKEQDESLKMNFKKIENLKSRSEKTKYPKARPSKVENNLRKIDEMLKRKTANVGSFKSSSKNIQNLSQKAKNLIKNKSILIKDGTSDFADISATPLGKININKQINDKTNPQNRKYQEKALDSIFIPVEGTLNERFDYKSGIRKPIHPNYHKQDETRQQNSILNEKYSKTKFDSSYNGQGVFNLKSKNQTSQKQNIIDPSSATTNTPNTPISEVNRNASINKNLFNHINHTKQYDKEKDSNKSQQNSVTHKSNLHKQILLNTSYESEKDMLDDNKKTFTTNIYGNVYRKHLQPAQDYKIEQYKSDSLENVKSEKLAHSITKLENKKYTRDGYNTVFKKRNHTFDKKFNTDNSLFKIKDVKNMKNALLGNLSLNKENMIYDKINKKAYELLVGKNSGKNNNRIIGNFKSSPGDKLCKDTKDFVKYKLRSKHLINKLTNIREKDNTSLTAKNKNIRTNSESKSNEEVKSICYNAFSNEVTQINNIAERCEKELISAINNPSTSKNNNIENNSIFLSTKKIKSIPEYKHNKTQTDISFQGNQSSLHVSKDLNMFMKTLDSDVFEYDDRVNTNDFTINEVKQVNTTKNDLRVPEEQSPVTDATASNQDHIIKKNNEFITSEINEVQMDLENPQTLHQIVNSEPTEMTFEDVIKEIKLALQPLNQQNKAIDTSKHNEDEKSFLNVIEDNSETENLNINNENKTNKGSDSFPQNKAATLKESPIFYKNMAHELISEEKDSVKNHIGFNQLKISKINNVLKNISKSSDKSRKILNKCHKGTSGTQTKVPGVTNNLHYNNKLPSTTTEKYVSHKTKENRNNKKTDLHEADSIIVTNNLHYNNKLPSTTTEKYVSNKTKGNRNNKKTDLHEGDSISYIKSLRISSKENNKSQRKNAKQEGFKVSIMNLNDLEVPVNPIKQKNTSIKNSIKGKKPLAPLSKYSKSFISSKYNLLSKKKNVPEMEEFFSGHVGQKVNEINKTEHSFSLRDKNGINNYFLLKGLLPKIKNNKHDLQNQNGVLSLLKTKVCNEDPFMSIKDKEKNKINTAKNKLVKPHLKKQINYTSNNGNSESASLLITHNSVYSSSCPVHEFKHYLNVKDDHSKSTSSTSKGNMLKINDAMLSNLYRMCNKVTNSEKNSSHQLSQKTHNFKLYSTSALPMKNKSPSSLCVEKRKTVKQVLSKNEVTGAKLPKGFIKKQRITKILEKDLKKINPLKSSKYRIAETQPEHTKTFKPTQAMERSTTQKACHFQPHVMGSTSKIEENFFNSSFNSSCIERYLKTPPKYIPRQELFHPKNYLEYRNSPKGRRVTDIYKINWSDSFNNKQQTKTNSVSVENDILVRGTCLDHVKNKFASNKATKHELSNDAYCDEQKTVVNSMDSSSLSNAFIQYTKDCVKCEYPTEEKLPSIRLLHKCAFRSK